MIQASLLDVLRWPIPAWLIPLIVTAGCATASPGAQVHKPSNGHDVQAWAHDSHVTAGERAMFDDYSDGTLDTMTVLDAALVVSGVDHPESRARLETQLDGVAARIRERVSTTGARGGAAQARIVLEVLHDTALGDYDERQSSPAITRPARASWMQDISIAHWWT